MKKFILGFFALFFILIPLQLRAQYSCRVIEFAELQTYGVDELRVEYCNNSKKMASNTTSSTEIVKKATQMLQYSRTEANAMMSSTKSYGDAWNVCFEQNLRIHRILKSKDIDISPKQCDAQ